MGYGALLRGIPGVSRFIIGFLASPYLLSLGMSKSLMSMVFVAGPLSGLIMQPIVGGPRTLENFS
jgi:hypothetical protein